MNYARPIAVIILFLALSVPATAAAAVPELPTELTGAKGLEVRPAVIGFTGDGSAWLGGFTKRHSLNKSTFRTLRALGHLRWSSWNAQDARATGAIWIDNGIPDEASGTFYPYSVEVRAWRPVNGIFTRLSFVYWTGDVPHATVRSAHFYPATQYGPGYWQWF